MENTQGRPEEQHRKCVFLVTDIVGVLRSAPLTEKKRTGSEQRGHAAHASLIVCYREATEKKGEIELLSFQYTKEKNGGVPWTTYKFPTETGLSGENPLQTAVSGICQELADNPNTFRFRFVSDEPIYVQVCESDRKRGQIGQHEGNEILGPPSWCEAEKLFELMEERGVLFHRIALLRALAYLAKDAEICKRYAGLLSDEAYQKYLVD